MLQFIRDEWREAHENYAEDSTWAKEQFSNRMTFWADNHEGFYQWMIKKAKKELKLRERLGIYEQTSEHNLCPEKAFPISSLENYSAISTLLNLSDLACAASF